MVVLTIALVASMLWVADKFFRMLFSRSTLDNIPGPPSESFMKGEGTQYFYTPHELKICMLIWGNFPRLFDRHGWDFMDELEEKYGSVVKLAGPLGVSQVLIVIVNLTNVHIKLSEQDPVCIRPKGSTAYRCQRSIYLRPVKFCNQVTHISYCVDWSRNIDLLDIGCSVHWLGLHW